MSFRGRGGRGHGGPPRAKEMAFDLFPDVKIGVVTYSMEEVEKYSQFVSWSQKRKKLDMESYLDKNLQVTTGKEPLCHLIRMDKDDMPADDLCGEHIVKKIKLGNEIDFNKLDQIVKIEEEYEEENEEEEVEEKEDEDEDEDDGELGDDGDYGQGEYFDDDEDDYNMVEEEDDWGFFA